MAEQQAEQAGAQEPAREPAPKAGSTEQAARRRRKLGRGAPRLGCVMVRCIGPADGMVEVDGVGANVREPRLPELKPPPMRASAPEPRKTSVAMTIMAAVTTRKTARNIQVLPIAAMLPLERCSAARNTAHIGMLKGLRRGGA